MQFQSYETSGISGCYNLPAATYWITPKPGDISTSHKLFYVHNTNHFPITEKGGGTYLSPSHDDHDDIKLPPQGGIWD